MPSLARLANGSYTHPSDPGEPSTKQPRVSIAPEEADLLAFVAEGKIVLEIGTGLGISTRALASTALGVVTVDIDPWVRQNIWPSLPHNVEKQYERAKLAGPFDLVFIDGDHSPKALADDIALARQVCPRGLLIAHDANALGHLLPDWYKLKTTHGLAFLMVGW